jgi:hypothetical protein
MLCLYLLPLPLPLVGSCGEVHAASAAQATPVRVQPSSMIPPGQSCCTSWPSSPPPPPTRPLFPHPQDWSFIAFNRLVTIPFLYLVIRYAATAPGVKLALADITLVNTLGAIALLFFCYDMVYVQFHRVLHIRALYPLVHKHHHRQHAPSRGNTDAVGVDLTWQMGACVCWVGLVSHRPAA